MAKRTNRVAWGLAVAVATSMSLMTPVSAQDPFGDIPSHHWAHQAIHELAAQGLVNGYRDGAFAGQRFLTRYEFAVAVQRLAEAPGRLDFPRSKPPSKPRVHLPVLSPPFPDVPKEHWATDAVDWVREKGIVAGYPDGDFRGHRRMNRHEVSLATHRLCDYFVGLFGNEPSQGPEPLGFGSETRPDEPISRYEFAVVLHQALAFYRRVVGASVEPTR